MLLSLLKSGPRDSFNAMKKFFFPWWVNEFLYLSFRDQELLGSSSLRTRIVVLLWDLPSHGSRQPDPLDLLWKRSGRDYVDIWLDPVPRG